MAFVLTADGGTESIRTRLHDLAGECLESRAVPYRTAFGPGARAEQDPADWWRGLVEGARAVITEAGIDAREVEAICTATTSCSVVALDEDGDALRPAIIWMDVRAGEEADAVLATGDAALGLNGAGRGPVSAEWMIPKALWLHRHEPEVFERAHRICEFQDFLTYHLTGEWAASLNNAGLRWHHRARDGGRPEGLVRALGLEALLEKWPGRVVAPGEVVGTLTARAAEALGLPRSVKVVQGGADAPIGMVGLGVHRPGQLALITGSSHLQFGVSETPISGPGLWGAYADIVYPGLWIVEGGQTSTGSIVNWLSRITGGPLDFDALNAQAARIAPGCDGLLVQDHFQGNRTPHTDPASRGAFVGLTLSHGLPHLFRATMEGIGFGTRAILEAFERAGYAATEMTVGGGAAASDLWLQIHADTSGLPVRVPRSADAPSTGAAVLAAVGAGHHATIADGIAAMVRPGREVEPIPANVERYREIYPRYAALYPALREATSA